MYDQTCTIKDGRKPIASTETPMNRLTSWRTVAATATVAALMGLAASAAPAQQAPDPLDAMVKDYLAAHPDQVGDIVKDYVLKHPDVFHDILVDAMKRQPPANAVADTAVKTPTANPAAVTADAIKSNAAMLFGSTHQVTLGNPHGDVTMVEFFDYNCGFCKGALPDMLTLLSDDPKLKIVLKEFPILGPGSIDAAHVAVAVRMQDASGQKYLAFHRQLLGDQGPVNMEKALAAAAAAGLDMAKLQHDMASDETNVTINETMTLARALSINGTPGYVIGDTIVPGAVGVLALKGDIATARAHLD
jgi:protein-disulfide isomerase